MPPVNSHCWRDRVAEFSARYLTGLKSRGWWTVFSAGTQDPIPSPFRWLINFSSFLLQDWNSRVPAACQVRDHSQLLCTVPTLSHIAPPAVENIHHGEFISCFESLLLWWAQSVLRAYLMGSQKVRHDWATERNWTELTRSGSPRIISLSSSQMTWDLNHVWKISVSFNNWERICVHSGTTLGSQSQIYA